MYPFIKNVHSFIPYLLLIALAVSSIVFLVARASKSTFKPGHKTLSLLVLILAHLQFLFGLGLYAISPLTKAAFQSGQIMKEPTYRFYAVEHIAIMIVAIVLITVGYSRAKRASTDSAKFGRLGWFYLIGLVLALSRIPWDVWPQ